VATPTPTAELDARYGEPGVSPVAWEDAERLLAAAELSWCTTVRPGGGPHTTPLVSVVVDGAVHITTGPDEQKARNLRADPRCTILTGSNALHAGTDVVVEGDAVRVTDDGELRAVADAFLAKYGDEWRFRATDGALHHDGGEAWAFRIAPAVAYAFAKSPYSHTRYRFG